MREMSSSPEEKFRFLHLFGTIINLKVFSIVCDRIWLTFWQGDRLNINYTSITSIILIPIKMSLKTVATHT